MAVQQTYTRKEVERLLQDGLEEHQLITLGLQSDIREADARAGQAWRLLRRYKSRVRQLVSQRGRVLALICPDHCPSHDETSYRDGYNRALSDMYDALGGHQK